MPSGGSNTTTTQSGPPPQVLANYQQVYGQAQGVAQQPYQPYNGSRIAGFTPQQVAGFNNVNTAVNAAQPFLNAASQYTTNAANALDPSTFQGTAAAYQNPGLAPYLDRASSQIAGITGGLNPQNFGQTVGNYYNPFAQSVVAPTQALFNEQNAEQLNQVRGNAASHGAFGGDREAIAEAQTARQQQLAEAPTLAQLQSTGYQQAVQNALASAGVGMQGVGQTLASGNLQQSGFNSATSAAQANAWLQSQAGFGMGNLANEAQSLGLQGANALMNVGGVQQQMAQQELNVPYQDFLAAQGYPFQVTNWLEGMATGTGGMSGQQGSSTSPGPSAASQIAGLGLAGAGLVGSLNQAGAFGSGAAGASALSDAQMAGLGLGSGADLSSLLVARGGRVPGFAAGGEILPWAPTTPAMMSIPDASVNIPQPTQGHGSGLLAPTGSTSTGSPSAGSQAQSAISDIASIATIAAMFLANGGRVDGDKLRALRSLRGITIPRRDAGGAAPDPAAIAMFGGNPQTAGIYGQYQGMPTEKLHELATRMPQDQLVQRALRQRQMQPQSDPAMQTAGMSPLQPTGEQSQAAPGGFASGGDVGDDNEGDMPLTRLPWLYSRDAYREPPPAPSIGITADNTTDWRDDAPALGQIAGMGQSPMGGPYGDFRMPPGGRPQDQMAGPAYADFRMPPGGRPQDYQMPMPAPQAAHAIPGLRPAASLPAPSGPTPPMSSDQGAGIDTSPMDRPDAPPQHQDAGQHSNFMSGPWGTLLAAGLGIMAGDSPHAGVNIGRGALSGLQFSEQIQQREEAQKLRMQQAADLAQYRRDMAGVAGQRANTGEQRANTYQQGTDQRGQYQQERNNIAARAAELRARGLDQQAANQQAMMEWRRGNQDISRGNQDLRSQGLDIQRGRAIVSGAQGQARLDQADTRIANSQANAQAALAIRRQALAQTKDRADIDRIQRATNSDIHAAASLAAGSGIPYPKALQQIQTGRGAAEEGQGLTPGTTTGTAPDQNKPSLSSIFGQ